LAQKRSIARRREILEAALACFSELGFEKTTMEDIRLRSKASTGSIYHHFKGKDQLAAALYVEGIAEYQAGFLRVLKSATTAHDGIVAAVRYHLAWVFDHPAWARFLFEMRQFRAVVSAEPTIREHNERFYREMASWFRPHIRAGRLRHMPRDVYAAVMLGPCMSFTRQWVSGRAQTELETATAVIAEATWRSLRGGGED
jgi:AcrR family transcriptional regulator